MSVIDWDTLKTDPEFEIARVCDINTGKLDEALQKHASLYAYSQAAYERARADEAVTEWEYEQEKARAFLKLREEGTAIGEANNTVELAENVIKARKKYMDAERHRRMLWALVEGLSHRRDMLVQLAARARAELQNNI